MSEKLYGEINDLRTAIRRAVNELDSAAYGEGFGYNLYYIKRDLETALKSGLASRTPQASESANNG